MWLMHHHPSTQDVVMYLGMVVTLEMHDGSIITGRVVAGDDENVYLSRSIHPTVPLHEIKQIDNYRQA